MLGTTNVGSAIAKAMREIERANPRLYGVFGDAPWTNKERLPDATLRDLIEHYSQVTLSIANVPEDELGVAYEFLIKKFADDSGHTAAEFYTNRTLVHLMTQMLDIAPGDSVYDPTCGSGGMLLSAAEELRRQGKEHRTLKLYGQERNLTTSAIARMNLFLHGIEDFDVVRGDTLANPAFLEGDRLRRFDVVLANPPYSIKAWDRTAWQTDQWGRNRYGTPPQGRADYAFWQHILVSMKPDTGRCAILFPHGVLFRDEEADMRAKIVQDDVIEAVLGLGPNLFYNSPMEACVVICRSKKPKDRKGKVLFIDAVERGHPRARPELSHPGPHRADRHRLPKLPQRGWLRPRLPPLPRSQRGGTTSASRSTSSGRTSLPAPTSPPLWVPGGHRLPISSRQPPTSLRSLSRPRERSERLRSA